MNNIKSYLKRYKILVAINQALYSVINYILISKSNLLYRNEIKLIQRLNLFAPNTSGTYRGLEKDIAKLTLLSANQIFPFLVHMGTQLDKEEKELVTAEMFCSNLHGEDFAAAIKNHFDNNGCDKAHNHNYHYIYGTIIKKIGKVNSILEIGLGTTNTDVVSNMGKKWVPGASLRAFRDFLPNAQIYGADIDKRVLFEDTRIKTFFVDQTDLSSFTTLGNKISTQLDLIIDDGLHSPNANIAVLSFSFKKLNVGGWTVIEDIVEEAAPFWKVVSELLPAKYKSYLIRAEGGLVFAVEKLSE